jgi:hypothetical protein
MRRSAVPFFVILSLAATHLWAQTEPAAGVGKKGAAQTKKKPGAESSPMSSSPAPRTGSMPSGAAPKGKLGTEPTANGKLGTDPKPGDPQSRPPRPY